MDVEEENGDGERDLMTSWSSLRLLDYALLPKLGLSSNVVLQGSFGSTNNGKKLKTRAKVWAPNRIQPP
jgi:hypothetical protein